MLLNERLADGLRAAGFEVPEAELYRSMKPKHAKRLVDGSTPSRAVPT